MYLQNPPSTQKELTGMGDLGGVFLLYSPSPSASLLPLLAILPRYAGSANYLWFPNHSPSYGLDNFAPADLSASNTSPPPFNTWSAHFLHLTLM